MDPAGCHCLNKLHKCLIKFTFVQTICHSIFYCLFQALHMDPKMCATLILLMHSRSDHKIKKTRNKFCILHIMETEL